MLRSLVALVLLAPTALPARAATSEPCTLLPPRAGVYAAAFPAFYSEARNEDAVTAERVAKFEKLVGKPIVWAYFSNHWFDGIRFPADAVRAIRAAGRVPFVRLMPWTKAEQGVPPTRYTMARIVRGDFDRDLRKWARAAKAAGGPLLAEFGTEVNGDWFPWNGRWNGGGRTGRYGDPALPDGPERFRDAYRHVVSLFREEQATNVTWFFHADAQSSPSASWNRLENYYPGDEYVDWVGLSVYGSQASGEAWESFADVIGGQHGYERITRMTTRPLALLEVGVREDPWRRGRKAKWVKAVLDAVASGKYPRVEALSWWHEKWENEDGTVSNLRVDSSESAKAAYRAGIASAAYTTETALSAGCR